MVRRDTGDNSKMRGEMRLTAETALQSDFAQRQIGRSQQRLSAGDAPFEQKLMRRFARRFFE